MKLNYKISYYLFLAGFCTTLFACRKLIEIPPNPADRISTEQAFSDSSNVMNVLAGLYNRFDVMDYAASPALFNGGPAVFTGMSGDELINHNISLLQYHTPYFRNSLLSTDAYIQGMWTRGYELNYMISQIIKNVENNPALRVPFRNQVIGEVLVVRAFVYFLLVNLFGDVPIVTSTDFKVTAIQPREPVTKVYEFMMADLEKASTLLIEEYAPVGRARPNLYTARALLARLYLYRKNWQKAEQLASEVIDAGIYSLEADLNSVFLNGSPEAIWQYPTTGAYFNPTNDAYNFIPNPGQLPDFEITPSLYDAFEADDLRKTSWIGTEDVNGTLYNYPFKYKIKNGDPSFPQEDYMILRLAEQYLIRAEARAQQDKPDLALEDLNLIRARAGLTDLSFTDQETLLADIMNERRLEFFSEWGHRWFDQKRIGKADITFGVKPNWEPKDALYPIPLLELQKNPFLKQNPGY